MIKKNFVSLFAFSVLAFTACNSDGDKSGTNDSTSTTTTTTTTGETSTSTGDYSAMADTFRMNSEAGKYLDVRTGKPIRISVDRTTGRKTNMENNEPVSRYIYKDTDTDWWVYDAEQNMRERRARMENNRVLFEDDDQKWVDYDNVKWKVDGGDGEVKLETGDGSKVKVEKDGDTKIKNADGSKTKIDEDGVKHKDKDGKKTKSGDNN
jgi:hypothetical protein